MHTTRENTFYCSSCMQHQLGNKRPQVIDRGGKVTALTSSTIPDTYTPNSHLTVCRQHKDSACLNIHPPAGHLCYLLPLRRLDMYRKYRM